MLEGGAAMAPVDAVAPGQYWPACATWALEKSRAGNRYRKADDGGGVTSRSRRDVIRGMMPGAAKYSRAGGSERVAVLLEICPVVGRGEGRLAVSMSSQPLHTSHFTLHTSVVFFHSLAAVHRSSSTRLSNCSSKRSV